MQFFLSTNETRELDGQLRLDHVRSPKRGESGLQRRVGDLIDVFRPRKILEFVCPEIGEVQFRLELISKQTGGRFRQQDLTAMPS